MSAPPHFVHTLVGSQIWEACWGPRHDSITDNHTVPLQLHNIIRQVVSGLAQDYEAQEAHRGEAKIMFANATDSQDQRKARGHPY